MQDDVKSLYCCYQLARVSVGVALVCTREEEDGEEGKGSTTFISIASVLVEVYILHSDIHTTCLSIFIDLFTPA